MNLMESIRKNSGLIVEEKEFNRKEFVDRLIKHINDGKAKDKSILDGNTEQDNRSIIADLIDDKKISGAEACESLGVSDSWADEFDKSHGVKVDKEKKNSVDESFKDKFNEFMGNDGDVDLKKEVASFTDEKLLRFSKAISEKEKKYPKWTPRGYQIDAIKNEMKKRNLK